MMKWLVIVLISVNGAIWWVADQVQPVRSVTDSPRRLPRVDPILLMSEYKGTEPDRPPSAMAVPESQETAATEKDSTPSGAVSVETLVEVSLPSADTSAPKPDKAQEPRPIITCFRAADFVSPEKARQWANEELGEESMYGVESYIAELPAYHWVIVPPLSNRREALTRLRELQRQGVDSYLVTEGEQTNAISLGLFQSIDAARDMMRRRSQQGIEVQLESWPREEERWAVEGRVRGMEFAVFKEGLSKRQGAVESVSCEGVALENKSP